MVYDDHTGRPVHLSLSLPDMWALADSMKNRPSQEVADEIVAAAEVSLEQSEDGLIDPYWLHAEVQETYEDVSLDQVAWVLLAWLQVPR